MASSPVTPERLAEIRQRARRCEVMPDHPGSMLAWQDSAKDVPALLAEVDRLRDERVKRRTLVALLVRELRAEMAEVRAQVARVRAVANGMHEPSFTRPDKCRPNCPGCRVELALDGTETTP